MKAKLFKIYTNNQTIMFNYGDDSTDITRHIVKNYSDWEEVDNLKLQQLKDWIQGRSLKDGFKYILITESESSVQEKIDEMIEEREDEIKKYEKEKLEEEEKKKKQKEERKAKELERLKKKLAKLQRESRHSV